MGEAKNKKAGVFHAFPCVINRYLYIEGETDFSQKIRSKMPKIRWGEGRVDL